MAWRKIATGKRGIIERQGQVVRKRKNPDSTAVGTVANEAKYLRKVNKLGIGPLFYKHDKAVYMEHVDGKHLEDFQNPSALQPILRSVFAKLRRLDKHNLDKKEMNHPGRHIIITDSRTVLIDFERCSYAETPQNVTQFTQYCMRDSIRCDLEQAPQAKVIQAARRYKQRYTRASFQRLLRTVGITHL